MDSALIKALNKVISQKPNYNLPDLLVMVDCEMTGVLPQKDSLLQVAALKLRREGHQYKKEGEPFVHYLAYQGKPETKFHKEYLTHIFEKCNQSRMQPPELKEKMHEWLGPEYRGKAIPVGDCVPADISFLWKNDCIDLQHYVNDEPVLGTFHYEFFDMNAPKEIARVKMGGKFETPDLDSNIHDALVDCENQTKELNHILQILLG